MKLTLTYVSTVNGKITKGDDPDVTKWSSPEDKEHFEAIRDQFPVIIRSSSTYKVAQASEREVRQIVMTRDPAKYESQSHSKTVEFTAESPKELIARLSKEGVAKALLAVGGTMAAIFFEEGLIDEFQVTLEPYVFGAGVNMIGEREFFTDLKLESVEQLNDRGTLLLTYSVLR